MRNFYEKAKRQAEFMAETDMNIARNMSAEGMARRAWLSRQVEAHRMAAEIIEAALFVDAPKWEAGEK